MLVGNRAERAPDGRAALVFVLPRAAGSGRPGCGRDRRRARQEVALLGRSYNPPTMALQAYDNAWKHWGLRASPPTRLRAASSASATACTRPRMATAICRWPAHRLHISFGAGQAQGPDRRLPHLPRRVDRRQVVHRAGQRLTGLPGLHRGTGCPEGRRVRPALPLQQRARHDRGRRLCRVPAGHPRAQPEPAPARIDLDLHDDMCEDPPAWWLLKKKTDDVPHRRRRSALGALADAQFMMARSTSPPTSQGRARLQGHPPLPALAGTAEVSAADRPCPGGPGAKRCSSTPAPAATAHTARSGRTRTR